MRLLLLIVSSLFLLLCNQALAEELPPFSLITITGETKDSYTKVSLFEGGSATKPLKTEYVSEFGGQYSIDIAIPSDMKEKGDYYFTDMRFWEDKNDNGIKEEGDTASACHFIIWVPATGQLYMQVYQGERIPIDSSVLYYNK